MPNWYTINHPTRKPSDPLLLANGTLCCRMYPAGKVAISRHLATPGFPQGERLEMKQCTYTAKLLWQLLLQSPRLILRYLDDVITCERFQFKTLIKIVAQLVPANSSLINRCMLLLQKGFHPIFYVKDVASPTFACLLSDLSEADQSTKQAKPTVTSSI